MILFGYKKCPNNSGYIVQILMFVYNVIIFGIKCMKILCVVRKHFLQDFHNSLIGLCVL